MIGFLGLLVIPHPRYPGLTYAFLFPIPIGVYAAVITLVSWVANNLAPTSKRACGLAVSIMMGNFGGAIGSNIYLTQEAPRYWTGYGVSVACAALAIICTFILRWAYKRENEKRDQMSEEEIRAKYSERKCTDKAVCSSEVLLTCYRRASGDGRQVTSIQICVLIARRPSQVYSESIGGE
jgi:hypothetical protein